MILNNYIDAYTFRIFIILMDGEPGTWINYALRSALEIPLIMFYSNRKIFVKISQSIFSNNFFNKLEIFTIWLHFVELILSSGLMGSAKRPECMVNWDRVRLRDANQSVEIRKVFNHSEIWKFRNWWNRYCVWLLKYSILSLSFI